MIKKDELNLENIKLYWITEAEEALTEADHLLEHKSGLDLCMTSAIENGVWFSEKNKGQTMVSKSRRDAVLSLYFPLCFPARFCALIISCQENLQWSYSMNRIKLNALAAAFLKLLSFR